MNKENWFVIKARKNGEWYDNAYISNAFDAFQVARFYHDGLGYYVQVWHRGKDITSVALSPTAKTVVVTCEDEMSEDEKVVDKILRSETGRKAFEMLDEIEFKKIDS